VRLKMCGLIHNVARRYDILYCTSRFIFVTCHRSVDAGICVWTRRAPRIPRATVLLIVQSGRHFYRTANRSQRAIRFELFVVYLAVSIPVCGTNIDINER